ncbi:MAG TPA: hypothetical protein VK698_25795 [Kofleriaceae bacterium]|nr:hypothetical protein [Kofleriaceae bacterium]
MTRRPGGLGREAIACAFSCALAACGRFGYEAVASRDSSDASPTGGVTWPIDGGPIEPDASVLLADAGAITCDDVCPGRCTASGRCVIRCPADGCTGQVVCPVGLACEVSCTGPRACESGVDCSGASECEVACTGDATCSAGVDCPAAGSCEVTCTGQDSCTGPIDCAGDGSCAIGCSGTGSCAGGAACGSGACSLHCTGEDSCTGPIDCAGSCACDVSCTGGDACGAGAECPDGCEAGAGCSSAPDECQAC